MEITTTKLPGVLIIDPDWIGDSRGRFAEVYHSANFAAHDIPPIVQVNVAYSSPGVLRGMHAQPGQGKLVQCVQGGVLDMVVDPATGRHLAMLLKPDHRQLYIPPGFLHGYQVAGGAACVLYGCTTHYDAETEVAVAWDDADLALPWFAGKPCLSRRDSTAGWFADHFPVARKAAPPKR